jgi:adenylate cyclase
MLQPTIRKRILGIALGLIFLMAITSALSTVMTRKIAHQLDEFSSRYVEAYGHLARMNIRSLEQALALRRLMIRPDAVAARRAIDGGSAENL